MFTYNLPANELEISQMISNLKDIVSSETLIGRLPFVADAKEEAEDAKEERETKQISRLTENSGLAAGGGY